MKRTLIYLISCILLLSTAYAGLPGEAVVSPFEISITARQTGVGEAFTAYYDCNSILYNPASLALLEYEYFTATHNRWIFGSSQSYFGMGLPFNWGFMSMGLIYFNQGEIEVFNNWINQYERKGVYDLGLVLGYGGRFHRYLTAGVNVKALYHDWADYTMATYALDVGAICPNVELPYGIGTFNAGLVVQNIGPKEKLRYVGFNQPMTPKLGIAVDFPSWQMFNFCLLADASYPVYDAGFRANLGLEIWAWQQLALRAGYRLGYDVEKANLTLGAGIVYKGFNFDYAVVNYAPYTGLTHRFTVCMRLNEMKPVGPFRVLDKKLDNLNTKVDKLQADVTDLKLSVDEVKDLIKTSLKTAIDMFYIRHFLNVLFPFDSYKIPKTEYWKIDEAVRLINVYYADEIIVLEGHTDVAGTDPYNYTLSDRRSQAVREYMISKGISADRIQLMPKGKSSPINYQTGPGARGMENRRVVFIVSGE
ncbi:MAG: OmpA family protein [Candidatus Latescibacteria bacterium]|nr:OmpA family protein [Candidatus Latescibacterota bacterium]